MRRLWRFSFFERFFALWAGMVFWGGIAYAQERNIDTLHIFKADTVRLGFDDVLQLSSLYDSADREDWHYIYRWSTGERTEAIQAKFNGRRKVLYTGERLSDIHWPGEYDTLWLLPDNPYGEDPYYVANPKDDTVILRAPAPKVDGETVHYEWSQDYRFDREMLPYTEQCAIVYRNMWHHLGWKESNLYYCQSTSTSDEGVSTRLLSECYLSFTEKERGFVQTLAGIQLHNYNIWSMPRDMSIYARLRDTLHLYSERNFEFYPEYAYWAYYDSLTRSIWHIIPAFPFNGSDVSGVDMYFRDSIFRSTIYYSEECDSIGMIAPPITRHVYFGIKPNAQIETDSVWVFFPQYPYSNLGGVVDICWPPDAPMPSASDTVHTFNLGPWNRELEYVEYAWFDGTKDISGADSVVGRDSVFHYTFGKMDSVSPELYAGTLVTRVASDSLWQDTCGCYVPCTDAACSGYDTVRIYLHLLPSLKENVLLPRDSVLCAHLDLELDLSDTADAYRCFWLDKDSIELPYGHDTTRFTV
ncbi:hypothetical protein HDR62_01125, partial [bacterium]|nr:hypothetical protein [bacterium]